MKIWATDAMKMTKIGAAMSAFHQAVVNHGRQTAIAIASVPPINQLGLSVNWYIVTEPRIG